MNAPQCAVTDLPTLQGRGARSAAPTRTKGASEVELLLACARLRLEEGDVERIRDLVGRGPDWNRLFVLAVFHRLIPFVVQNLTTAAADLVPERNLEFLRTRLVQDASEALRQTAQLLEIIQLFEDGGVFAIPYKGPALAVQVYGNLAFRKCGDLDILVGSQDVPRARELLERAHFVPRHVTTPASRDFMLKHRHSEIFNRRFGPTLELHWAFAKQRGVFDLSLDNLRPRLQELNVGGALLPMLGREDLLLVLCVHGANHLWSRLEWLCSVAELIRSPELDWTEALNRAVALSVERFLFLGLLLAHDLLNAPIPGDVLSRARADRNTVRLTAMVEEWLVSGEIDRIESLTSLPRDRFRLQLQSTSRNRLRYVFHRLTTPTREDTRLMLPVGSRSVPLPAFLRPFHIVAVLVGGMLRRPSPKKQAQQREL